MYKGKLEIENLADLSVLNYLEIVNTDEKNVITFTSKYIDFPFILSDCLKSSTKGNKCCYAHFEESNIHFIVMKNRVFSYNRQNHQEKEQVYKECIRLGIQPLDLLWMMNEEVA